MNVIIVYLLKVFGKNKIEIITIMVKFYFISNYPLQYHRKYNDSKSSSMSAQSKYREVAIWRRPANPPTGRWCLRCCCASAVHPSVVFARPAWRTTSSVLHSPLTVPWHWPWPAYRVLFWTCTRCWSWRRRTYPKTVSSKTLNRSAKQTFRISLQRLVNC